MSDTHTPCHRDDIDALEVRLAHLEGLIAAHEVVLIEINNAAIPDPALSKLRNALTAIGEAMARVVMQKEKAQ